MKLIDSRRSCTSGKCDGLFLLVFIGGFYNKPVTVKNLGRSSMVFGCAQIQQGSLRLLVWKETGPDQTSMHLALEAQRCHGYPLRGKEILFVGIIGNCDVASKEAMMRATTSRTFAPKIIARPTPHPRFKLFVSPQLRKIKSNRKRISIEVHFSDVCSVGREFLLYWRACAKFHPWLSKGPYCY